jgi:hypothetical protein
MVASRRFHAGWQEALLFVFPQALNNGPRA